LNAAGRNRYTKITDDFTRDGYSHFRLPRELLQEAQSLATFFYGISVVDRLSGLARAESGVLGYYPSEREAEEVRNILGHSIPTLSGKRSRCYSSFDFLEDGSVYLGTNPLLREGRWIDKYPAVKQRALSLYGKIKALMKELSCNLSVALASRCEISRANLPEFFRRDCLCLMRLLKYRVDEVQKISKEHTDYEFLTLTIPSCEGLEVKSPAGVWEAVPCQDDLAVLLPGDMFEAVTDGYIRSTLHRVRIRENERKSVNFFQGLPLDFEFHCSRLGDMVPRTFGGHVFSMLLRGAAHLAPQAEELAKQLNIMVPSRNPFRLGK
jgi:isopenicillin N synthase-like dioxygenase